MNIYCQDCDFPERHSQKQATWHWLCTRFKRRPSGAIAPHILDVDPPFERCVDVNKFNNCCEYTPKKDKDDAHP